MTVWKVGDRVEITMDAPGIQLMPDPDYPVPGILVELEERFEIAERILWRASFVDRVGSIVVAE